MIIRVLMMLMLIAGAMGCASDPMRGMNCVANSEREYNQRCLQVRKKIARIKSKAGSSGFFGQSGLSNRDAEKVAELEQCASQLKCGSAFAEGGNNYGARLEQCFNFCMKVTKRTNEECFDICNK